MCYYILISVESRFSRVFSKRYLRRRKRHNHYHKQYRYAPKTFEKRRRRRRKNRNTRLQYARVQVSTYAYIYIYIKNYLFYTVHTRLPQYIKDIYRMTVLFFYRETSRKMLLSFEYKLFGIFALVISSESGRRPEDCVTPLKKFMIIFIILLQIIWYI